MQQRRYTLQGVAALILGLLPTACVSGTDHNSSPIGQVGYTLNGACTASSPCSIWPTTATPAGSDNTTSVELGVKVWSSQAGYITGIRFYKDDTNNATHTVNLWDGMGTLLATATSTSEGATGWQTVSFAQAVAVIANEIYVASYLMPGGNFALDRPGFSSAVVNAPLEALADGQYGGNGVYAYGSSSSFPSNSVGASNYWVDVLFSATAPVPGCTPSSPCSIWPTTATPAGFANTTQVELGVKVQSSEAGYITGVRFYNADGNYAHSVHLWDHAGNLLATATTTTPEFMGGAGWQTAWFAQAVAVSANTTYVASYLCHGGFALDRPGFSSAVVNAPLEALADGQDGPNGVYHYGYTSSFPSDSYGASNYWVDVLFSTTLPPIQQYVAQYAQAYCSGLGKCCPGYPAAFDLAGCAAASTMGAWEFADSTTGGWENTLPQNPAVYSGVNITFNATQGAACISALQNFACTTGGTVTAAQYASVTTACNGVLGGALPSDSSGCLLSFECLNGFCVFPGEPNSYGTGYCTAFVGSVYACGSSFAVNRNGSPDEMCSHAGANEPRLWCNAGTCAAPLADGASCSNGNTCASLMCGDHGCGGTGTYPTAAFCARWQKAAGGD